MNMSKFGRVRSEMKDSYLSETNYVFSPSSCLFLCRNRIKAVLFTLQKYVTETKIRCLLCMQHEEKLFCTMHLCILVLPIYLKCVQGYTQHVYPHSHIYVYICLYMQQLKELYYELKIAKWSVYLKQNRCLALNLC